MQPARGTVHTVGDIAIITNAKTARYCEEYDEEELVGVVIEMTAEQARLAGTMLRATVEVWPACADDLALDECTPENYAHLKQRLAAAADNLAREVRSNQAAALVRSDLERDADLLRAANASLTDEVARLAADLAEALSEVSNLQERLAAEGLADEAESEMEPYPD